MRRIYCKENRSNSFRFRKKSTELSAIPVGEPKIVSVRHVDKGNKTDRQLFRKDLLSQSPKFADAYLVGADFYDNASMARRIAVQFFKIKVIH